MTVRFSAGSVTVLPKTAQINQTLDTDSARETLLEITRELVSGSGVKSGYLRLHLDKDSPTLSRGGGHVRSGYSAARSLVEQLVHTAYGENSPAAASLQTYLNGRTKIGTRSLVKLVAAMAAQRVDVVTVQARRVDTRGPYTCSLLSLRIMLSCRRASLPFCGLRLGIYQCKLAMGSAPACAYVDHGVQRIIRYLVCGSPPSRGPYPASVRAASSTASRLDDCRRSQFAETEG